MFKHRWLLWLIGLIGLVAITQSVGWLLGHQQLPVAGRIVFLIGWVAAFLWWLGGIFAFVQKRWVVWSLLYLALVLAGEILSFSFMRIEAVGAAITMAVLAALLRMALVYRAYETRPSWRRAAVTCFGAIEVLGLFFRCMVLGYGGTAIALGGIYCMAALFQISLGLIRLAFSGGGPVLGVAQTVVDEAMKMRIVFVLLVLVMLIVPILPFLGQADDPSQPTEWLKYRIGTFLAWSLSVSTILLSLMTIFLACWTICAEVRLRQIHLTLTKPVGRWQYLMGKWVGIGALDLVLVAVVGVGIYCFALVMEQMQVRDGTDRLAVREEILTARVAMYPELPDMANLVAKQLKKSAPSTQSPPKPSPAQIKAAANQVLNQWHTVAYRGSQTYTFKGLGEAKNKSQSVQLKLKPAANNDPDSGVLHFSMQINGRPYMIEPLVLDLVHVLTIPSQWIDDNGRLELSIINKNPVSDEATFKTDLSFTPYEGMQILYRYGHFAPNLIRALLMIWVQLCFLTMVGLAAGTAMGFPVACLLALIVYFTALLSGYLDEALTYYVIQDKKNISVWEQFVAYPSAFWEKIVALELWEATKIVIKVVGRLFLTAVPSFSKHNPIPMIADGQAVRYSLVIRSFVLVGLVWTGLTALIGHLIFRRRELASVTV